MQDKEPSQQGKNNSNFMDGISNKSLVKEAMARLIYKCEQHGEEIYSVTPQEDKNNPVLRKWLEEELNNFDNLYSAVIKTLDENLKAREKQIKDLESILSAERKQNEKSRNYKLLAEKARYNSEIEKLKKDYQDDLVQSSNKLSEFYGAKLRQQKEKYEKMIATQREVYYLKLKKFAKQLNSLGKAPRIDINNQTNPDLQDKFDSLVNQLKPVYSMYIKKGKDSREYAITYYTISDSLSKNSSSNSLMVTLLAEFEGLAENNKHLLKYQNFKEMTKQFILSYVADGLDKIEHMQR